MDCYASCIECPQCGHWSLDPGIGCERRRCAYVKVNDVTPAQQRAATRAAERGTAAEREAATAMHTPVEVPSSMQTWAQLRAELPGLTAWVSDHGDEAVALAERIRVGGERRVEAVSAGDDEALVAIEERLADLSQQMWGLDHGARRLGVVRALLYLHDVAGPCTADVVVPDTMVEVHVR
jgi:hypothetical protein